MAKSPVSISDRSPLIGSVAIPSYSSADAGSAASPMPVTEPSPAPEASTSTLPPSAPATKPVTTPRFRFRRTPHQQATTPGQVPWWQVAHLLENKGSVARDHLAGERTYLAWLRTSLSLASIGIAITQLFRLGTTVNESPASSLYTQFTALSKANEDSTLASLQLLLLDQQRRLDALEVNNNPAKYRHLGKPVGGTFIVLALVFLILGTRRYFKVQNALMHQPSRFPPSRRSVAFSTLTVALVVIAGFAAIMATK